MASMHPAAPPTIPTRLGELYDIALVQARAVAREHGYALAVHGSQMRDLDLVAVPWVEDVSSPAILAEAIREIVGGSFTTPDVDPNAPAIRPHGRLSWAITLPADWGLCSALAAGPRPFHPYIDLSVMSHDGREGGAPASSGA